MPWSNNYTSTISTALATLCPPAVVEVTDNVRYRSRAASQITLPESDTFGVCRRSDQSVTGASQKAVSGQCPSRRLIRLISARSTVVARPVTQDDAPSLCTLKAGTTRGFCENLTTNLRSPPEGASGAFTDDTARTKRRNEGVSIGP
jgi:hypothetical protein